MWVMARRNAERWEQGRTMLLGLPMKPCAATLRRALSGRGAACTAWAQGDCSIPVISRDLCMSLAISRGRSAAKVASLESRYCPARFGAMRAWLTTSMRCIAGWTLRVYAGQGTELHTLQRGSRMRSRNRI